VLIDLVKHQTIPCCSYFSKAGMDDSIWFFSFFLLHKK